MAFTQSNAAPANANATSTNDEKWKAQGFVNVYMDVEKKGKTSRMKVGVLPLKDSVELHKLMREWLEKDEGNAQKLLSRFVLEYRSAEPQRGDLKLGFEG